MGIFFLLKRLSSQSNLIFISNQTGSLLKIIKSFPIIKAKEGGFVIPHSEVGNKPEREVGRSMGFGNTPVGLKFISTLP
jgi:hypothetical protein